MKIALSSADPLNASVDFAVIGVPEGASPRAGAVGLLGKALGPVVGKTLRRDHFTGKRDQMVELTTNGTMKPAHILLVGLGSEAPTPTSIRIMAAKAARHVQAKKATSLALEVPFGVQGGERAAAEGVVLGAYRFTKYFTGDRLPKASLERVSLVSADKVSREQRDEVALGQQVGEAVCIARDLVNEPPNELYPEAFAKFCQGISKERGLKCTVMDAAALKKKGMNLHLAVGAGSAHQPRLIHMTYSPTGVKNPKRLVFVGKGITFDSGGLCIKPAPGMDDMKSDMGGAANVAALMAAVGVLRPDVEVHGIIAAAENMPDGAAYRPSDIFTSYDGKTVEIINTDAEGRLVLADALAYARELQPQLLLCNATLTGACVVALGPTVSAYYATDDTLAEHLKQAAATAGEAMWQMPLVEDLREGLKSDYADLKHTADRWGGSITAALFLREFVGDAPFLHLDIAGPSLAKRPYSLYTKGGTGHGVLTYLALIERMAAS